MTPAKQQDEMWIEVLAWMGGWNKILLNYRRGEGLLPRLTLDALHEAERKLPANLKRTYSETLRESLGLFSEAIADNYGHFNAISATKDQRLLALWRLVGLQQARRIPTADSYRM